MIGSQTGKYVPDYCGVYLSKYISNKSKQDARINHFLILLSITILIMAFVAIKPIFACTVTINTKEFIKQEKIHLEKNFEENIKNKYSGSYINFPTKGVAHIKQTKYINSKPIKVNIVEINTKVNPNLKIKPQIAGEKLNRKSSIRKIAQKEDAIIAINGGFFKPQTGIPLGALVIDKEVLTGPIFNRVGIGIFENQNNTEFIMENVAYDIKAHTDKGIIPIDNINQPRMLSTYTLLYSSAWGKNSPVAPKNCYNMQIRNDKIIKISANPIEIGSNDYIIQAPKGIIKKLANNNRIKIEINIKNKLQKADHIIGAGPYLIKDSQIYVDYKEQKLTAIAGKNPRSAIGYKNDGTFIFVTIDGREKYSVGMTLWELAKLMKNLGCEYAMNFDGGSSSALYVKGKIVNSALNKEGIAVSNALIVSEIKPEETQISSLSEMSRPL